jgi:hypothetical protein
VERVKSGAGREEEGEMRGWGGKGQILGKIDDIL